MSRLEHTEGRECVEEMYSAACEAARLLEEVADSMTWDDPYRPALMSARLRVATIQGTARGLLAERHAEAAHL